MAEEGPLEAVVRVPSMRAGAPLNRRLFGKFTEHLGRNVYGGAWAQIVANPAFAPAHIWPERSDLPRRLNQDAFLFGLPDLPSAVASDVPPWWAVRGPAVPEVRERNGRFVLRLTAGPEAELLTGVHLPTHRACDYQVALDLRGTTGVLVSLRLGDRVWSRTRIPADGAWATRGGHPAGWRIPSGGHPLPPHDRAGGRRRRETAGVPPLSGRPRGRMGSRGGAHDAGGPPAATALPRG